MIFFFFFLQYHWWPLGEINQCSLSTLYDPSMNRTPKVESYIKFAFFLLYISRPIKIPSHDERTYLLPPPNPLKPFFFFFTFVAFLPSESPSSARGPSGWRCCRRGTWNLVSCFFFLRVIKNTPTPAHGDAHGRTQITSVPGRMSREEYEQT